MISAWMVLVPLAVGQAGPEMELGVLAMVLRAGFVVQMVLLSLLGMSVMTWAIIFYKWRLFREAQRETRRFHQLFLHQQRMSVIHEAAESMRHSPVAAVFSAGYIELKRIMKISQDQSAPVAIGDPTALTTELSGMDNVSRALSKASESELTRMERALPFLATTGSTAPFIGLFGTVWGIMNAFRNIGLVGSASLASVAPGISEALVATAAGLAAAIPAVVAYNYFTGRIRVMDNDMRTFIAEFLNIIERQIRRGA